MKTRISLLVTLFMTCLFPALHAEDRLIVVSPAEGTSEGLDLNAVGELFKTAETLQDFERMLNEPELMVNNLDLNGDGQVDFLRVLEERVDSGRVIIIQAILGDEAFTDVAYIDIQEESDGNYQIQVRGETSLYGENRYYITRTRYVTSWPILVHLYEPDYHLYHSPYYWDYYPDWYYSYGCIRTGFYRARVAYRYPSHYFRFSFQPYFRSHWRDHHSSHRHYKHFRNVDHDRHHPRYRDRDAWRRGERHDHDRSGWRDRDGRWVRDGRHDRDREGRWDRDGRHDRDDRRDRDGEPVRPRDDWRDRDWRDRDNSRYRDLREDLRNRDRGLEKTRPEKRISTEKRQPDNSWRDRVNIPSREDRKPRPYVRESKPVFKDRMDREKVISTIPSDREKRLSLPGRDSKPRIERSWSDKKWSDKKWDKGHRDSFRSLPKERFQPKPLPRHELPRNKPAPRKDR